MVINIAYKNRRFKPIIDVIAEANGEEDEKMVAGLLLKITVEFITMASYFRARPYEKAKKIKTCSKQYAYFSLEFPSNDDIKRFKQEML